MDIADILIENNHLRAEVQQLQREKVASEQRVARLKAKLQALKEELETTRRRGKRQMGPVPAKVPYLVWG